MFIKTIGLGCLSLLAFQGTVIGADVRTITEQDRQECPQCFHKYVKYSYRVLLPAGMRVALKKYSPTFRIFGLEDYQEELQLELQPWSTNLICYSAVFRDFNGDGRFDAAVLGEYSEKHLGEGTSPEPAVPGADTRNFAVLAILSQGTTNYTVIEVTRIGTSKTVSTYLGLSTPGKKSEIGTDGSEAFKSENYGISVTEGVGVTVYHWDPKQKHFREIVTGGM